MRSRVVPEVIRAKEMGFCFGVKGAVELAEELAETRKDKKIYMLGMLVHNEHVIDKLKSKGVEILEEADLLEGRDNLAEGDIVVVRAHGTIKPVYDKLLERKAEIHDAACIFVTTIRKTLQEKEREGYEILFLGDINHPEVRGIISFGKTVRVIEGIEELKATKIEDEKKYALLTQTTLNKNKFLEVKKYIESNYHNIDIFDKICGATYVRQKAVEELAKEVDLVLVVGGKKSSNTKKLYEISKRINLNTYLVQDETSLDRSWFEKVKRVGITAGASTPEEVIVKIENIIRGTI